MHFFALCKALSLPLLPVPYFEKTYRIQCDYVFWLPVTSLSVVWPISLEGAELWQTTTISPAKILVCPESATVFDTAEFFL